MEFKNSVFMNVRPEGKIGVGMRTISFLTVLRAYAQHLSLLQVLCVIRLILVFKKIATK